MSACSGPCRRACSWAMKDATKKALMVAAGGVAVFGLVRFGGWMLADEADAAGTEFLANQIWIDHFPEDNRDMVGHLVLVDHPDGKGGATGHSSMWRHRVEIFLWAQERDTVLMRFPQSGHRGKVKARTWRCEGEAPEPFELCLELKGKGDRVLRLYSREDWIVKPQDVSGSFADIAEQVPALGGTFDQGALDRLVHEGELTADDDRANYAELGDPETLLR